MNICVFISIFLVILSGLSGTPGQMIASSLAVGFCCAASYANTRTYNVLALISLINAGLHWALVDIPAWSLWWPAIYGTLDLLTIAYLIKKGSNHVFYQVSLLSLLVTLHLWLAIDLGYNLSIVFDWYFPAILLIMIAQIVGAFGGGIRAFFGNCFGSVWRKRHIHAHINNKSRS